MSDLIGQNLGRYHILEQLGEGGMATVYKAFDTQLERDVAIKVIRRDSFPPNQLERILKRFEREAKALARLSHPNIVKVHDYGDYEGAPYLVMEYLPGGTLKQRLGKPIAWQEAMKLLTPIARALDFAHRQGMVHRDVKPANILITADGDPMLTDFGIAKILENDEGTGLTSTGMGIGTPEYMAPEQWTGQAGPKSDIYSMGVVFYEMVTGRKPYVADTPAAILLKQANEPLPRPKQFVPGLPDQIERILLKALAKRSEDRYQSMAEFDGAMETLLAGSSPPSYPAFKPVPSQPRREGSMTTIEQDESQETRLQEATHDLMEKSPTFSTRAARDYSTISPPPARKKINWLAWTLGGGGVVLLTSVAILIIALGSNGALKPAPIFTSTFFSTFTSTYAYTYTLTPTQTIAPTFTFTFTHILIPTATFTSTLLPSGSTFTRLADKMVMAYVPAGKFNMGSVDANLDLAVEMCNHFLCCCQRSSFVNEQPLHTVYLDTYWIDETEVTNAKYILCVQAGVCKPPHNTFSWIPRNYYGNSFYDNYPVVMVDWNQANTYCRWTGARLPTEAEWEKAARGTDGRTYPWGNTSPTCSLSNFTSSAGTNDCVGDTTAVGSYPSGASPYGALDMAGNAAEWVNDWYSDTYYIQSPESNPQGPTSGTSRVVRGGSLAGGPSTVRSASRHGISENIYGLMGFRCARSAP